MHRARETQERTVQRTWNREQERADGAAVTQDIQVFSHMQREEERAGKRRGKSRKELGGRHSEAQRGRIASSDLRGGHRHTAEF